jgi:hypothetical protein
MAYNSAAVTNVIQGIAAGKHDLLYTLRKVSEARVVLLPRVPSRLAAALTRCRLRRTLTASLI